MHACTCRESGRGQGDDEFGGRLGSVVRMKAQEGQHVLSVS